MCSTCPDTLVGKTFLIFLTISHQFSFTELAFKKIYFCFAFAKKKPVFLTEGDWENYSIALMRVKI